MYSACIGTNSECLEFGTYNPVDNVYLVAPEIRFSPLFTLIGALLTERGRIRFGCAIIGRRPGTDVTGLSFGTPSVRVTAF